MTREGIEIKKIIKEKRKRIISICAVIFLLMAAMVFTYNNYFLYTLMSEAQAKSNIFSKLRYFPQN